MKNMFLIFVLFCSMTMLFGQTPSTLSLQGVLREASGYASPDGDYSMTFKIYDVATAGTALWTETQSVRVTNGAYSVQLGAVTALNLNFDRQYYVGVSVGGSELAPRMVLTAAPYAMGLKGSSNVFGGGGNVGIGTTTPDPAQKLHVLGNAYIAGNLGVTQDFTVIGNGNFPGPISTFGTSANTNTFNVYGALKSLGSLTAANATVNGSLTAASVTVNGDATVTGTLNGNGGVKSFGKPVVTSAVETIIACGSYVSTQSTTNIYNSIPPDSIKIAKNSTGVYTLTLPVEFKWSKASSLQVTPLNVSGNQSPVIAAVESWGGTDNTVKIHIRQTISDAFVDRDFSFYFVYKK